MRTYGQHRHERGRRRDQRPHSARETGSVPGAPRHTAPWVGSSQTAICPVVAIARMVADTGLDREPLPRADSGRHDRARYLRGPDQQHQLEAVRWLIRFGCSLPTIIRSPATSNAVSLAEWADAVAVSARLPALPVLKVTGAALSRTQLVLGRLAPAWVGGAEYGHSEECAR